MSLAIVGIGTALPATKISQEEAMRIAQVLCGRTREQSTRLPLMYGQTGINTRHFVQSGEVIHDLLNGTEHSKSVFLPQISPQEGGPTTGQRMKLYMEAAAPLALQAAQKALQNSRMESGQITHLVTVSCTGFGSPGVDLALMGGLHLRPTVQRVHVGFMGCHGAINGLRVASAFAGADEKAHVLLCAVELPSLHYHYGWDPPKMIANALFADGAAAVVGVARELNPSSWTVTATGSCVLPGSADDMSWTIGDHGFEMTLSKQVPGIISRYLGPWLTEWLREHGLTLKAIRSWIVHPGGPRILTAVEEALNLTSENTVASRAVLSECGNMSSPTVLFILDRLRMQNAPRPAVALAFGPGLVAEAALFQ